MKNKNFKLLSVIGLLIFQILLSMQGTQVQSAPLNPINVKGYVFDNNSIGVSNGIPVIVLNTNTSNKFTTEVSAPPVAQLAGSYSLTILGSTGDMLIVRAYNDTHYGESNTTIQATTMYVNVTMNLTRAPELNVTIIKPQNNTAYNSSDIFNVTANISVLGADGQNCNVSINISDETDRKSVV